MKGMMIVMNWENEMAVELLGELELAQLDRFLEDTGMSMSFYELVKKMMGQGFGMESISDVIGWFQELLFSEIQANKLLFLEVILITFCFSLLKNTAGDFGSSYISEVCFLLVYSLLALMLLKSMYIFQEIVTETIEKSVSFMKLFIPCYCTGMVLSSNVFTSGGFYQIAFFVIYLVEWAFEKLLLPCIHVYVLLQIFNHFFKETQFGNLAELIQTVVNWGVKIAVTTVFGLSTVQNLMNPVKDRLQQGTISKVISVIPSGAVNGIGEIMLGAGMMIKNGLGIAGIVVLLCIGMGPIVKTGVLSLFYKLMAAVTEPLSDRRISGCIKQLSNGAILYMKVQGYCIMMLFLTIALTIAATSFVY